MPPTEPSILETHAPDGTRIDLKLWAPSIETIERNSDVVAQTDGLSREDWLALRKQGLGGSDAAGVVGLSPWESPFSVWVDKTTDEISDEETDRMKWGKRLERPIMEGFSQDTDIPVMPYPMMLRSKEWPWMQVNLDGVSPTSVVEVKNVDRFMAEEWDNGAVPMHYMIQGQHSNAVTGLPGTHFAALIGGNDLRAVYVERNDRLIEDLVESERKFWDLVKELEMPELDGLRATKEAIGRAFGNPDIGTDTEMPPETLALIAERAGIKEQMRELEDRKDAIENTMKLWLGNAEIGTVDGLVVFTWKSHPRKGYIVEPKESIRSINIPKKPKPLNPGR